jgi:hypothetical protein
MTSGELPRAEVSGAKLSGLSASDRSRLPVVPRWLATIGIVAVLLAASAWAIGQQFGSSTVRHGAKHAAVVPPGYTQFKDPGGLFEASYPSSWKRVPTNAQQAVLLVEGPAGISALMNTTPLGAVVNGGNLLVAKPLADRVVHSGKDVRYLKNPQQVTLAGLPGFLYLYTFVDPHTGIQGAHAHYFLFDGRTMITLVFQSLPSTGFLAAAPIFDRIAQSLRILHH